MYPAAFEYHAPTTLEEALKLLADHKDEAKILAGGQSLVPMMKMRLATPSVIIDLNRVRELFGIREEGGYLLIGAMTRHHDVATSESVRRFCPLLAECAAQIGDVQVRNRGTIGGSLAHADPAADYPATVLAADAEIKALSTRGERWIKAEDFFVDLFTTALEPDELITEIRVPALPGKTGSAYLKFEQLASGFALCGVAVRVTMDGGVVQDIRVGITGVAPKAYRAKGVEDALKGKTPDAATMDQAVQRATDGITPLNDIHASSDYRAHLARVLTKRALQKAIKRTQG